MAKFIQLTRTYKSGEEVKKQPLMISVDSIDSFRPRNTMEGHRTTVVSKSGKYYNVAEKFSDLQRLIEQSARA